MSDNPFVLHAPGETLDYGFDWSVDGWLAGDDTIASSTWEIVPSDDDGPNLTDASNSDTKTSVTVDSILFGKTYELKNMVTTVAGLVGIRTIILRGGNP